jgi:ParB family chromosome partitioning protein
MTTRTKRAPKAAKVLSIDHASATAPPDKDFSDGAAAAVVGWERFDPALPIAEIFESPKNPRKHFDAAALQSLGESIVRVGQQDDVIVRPVMQHGRQRYELASGHRRWRAMKLVGLTTIKAKIREMDDRTFFEVLNVTNAKRQDVNPMEQAEGFRAWMQESGETAQELADRIGEKVSLVQGRLKLLELSPALREALARELISLGVATELGKVDHDTQHRALKELCNLDPVALETAAGATNSESVHVDTDDVDTRSDADDLDINAVGVDSAIRKAIAVNLDANKRFMVKPYLALSRPTVPEVHHYLAENVYVQLSRAPFGLADSSLVKSAGSCMACPKRSGITQDLFAETNGHDVCLDRACFHQKVLAHIDQVVDDTQRDHPTIHVVKISGGHGKVPRGVLKRDMYKEKGPLTDDRPTRSAIIGVFVDGADRGTAVWITTAKELAEKAIAGKAVKPSSLGASTSQSSPPYDWKAHNKMREEKQDIFCAGLEAVFSACVESTAFAELSDDALVRLLASLCLSQLDTVREELTPVFRLLQSVPPDKDPEEQLHVALTHAPMELVSKAAARLLLIESLRYQYNEKLPDALLLLANEVDVDAKATAKAGSAAKRAHIKRLNKEASSESATPTKKKTTKQAAKKTKVVSELRDEDVDDYDDLGDDE